MTNTNIAHEFDGLTVALEAKAQIRAIKEAAEKTLRANGWFLVDGRWEDYTGTVGCGPYWVSPSFLQHFFGGNPTPSIEEVNRVFGDLDAIPIEWDADYWEAVWIH